MVASYGKVLICLPVVAFATVVHCSNISPPYLSASPGASLSYTLVSRENNVALRRRHLDATTTTTVASSPSPALVSFDGDLDAIHELALAKGSRSNVRETFSCDDQETAHLEIVQWMYSIETVPTAVIPTVYGEVQEMALEHVAPNLLVCLNESAAYANIVALDTTIPGDQESEDSCEPILDSSNVCTNVIGRMRLFLSNKESVDTATALVMQNIKVAFLDPDFVASVGSGLLRISFADTGAASSENPIKEEPISNPSNASIERGDEGLSLSSALVMSFSALALIFFVGSIYIWRRGQIDNEQDGTATGLANSSSFNGTTTFDNSRRPTSPYSEMVSSSYRLDRLGEMSILSNSNMSPVYEQDQEDTDTAAGSIILSDGGYTTDAGATEGGDSTYFDGSLSKFSSSQSEPVYLGARPFPGTVNMNMEEISDSDLDTSGEMSPVKLYIGSNKLLLTDNDDESSSVRDDESMLFSPAKATGRDGGGETTVMSDVISMSPQYEAPSP